MATIDADLMTPDEVLHWLDRFCISYKVQKGAFVTAKSIMLADDCKQRLPNLIRSIEHHADALADLCATRTPQTCEWCKQPIRSGKRFVRVYAQEEGRRYTFHQECHADRCEALPHLPLPDILLDEPGYTVLIEDGGLCCYCNMAEAVLPAEVPNVCARCWKIREKANASEAARAAAASA